MLRLLTTPTTISALKFLTPNNLQKTTLLVKIKRWLILYYFRDQLTPFRELTLRWIKWLKRLKKTKKRTRWRCLASKFAIQL